MISPTNYTITISVAGILEVCQTSLKDCLTIPEKYFIFLNIILIHLTISLIFSVNFMPLHDGPNHVLKNSLLFQAYNSALFFYLSRQLFFCEKYLSSTKWKTDKVLYVASE